MCFHVAALPWTKLKDYSVNKTKQQKMKNLDILNIYKLNLYQIWNIMFRVETNSIRETLQNKFKIMEHNYSTRNSEYNFKEPNILFRVTKFAILSCGPRRMLKSLAGVAQCFFLQFFVR